MKPIKTNFVLLAFAAVFIFQREAPAQYQVLNSTFSSGGGAANNSSFQIDYVIGEPAIGEGSNSSFAMQAGFVYAATSSQLPPSAWDFVANTGVNATIAVPAAINPTIGAQPLQSSDAVGVFFERNGAQICAGYSFWQPGENMAITAWGDNPQTPLKDGFAEGELIRYKIWAASESSEYEATVAYRSGGPNYTANGVYELSSLRGVTTVTHSNTLAAGWNMISSYVEPASPGLETLLAGIISEMVIMKNGRGQVFWPSLGINQIGEWNPRDGYQIFMQSPEALALSGNPIAPEATPIALQAGWSLVAYLRSAPMQIAPALVSIKDNLIIVKNNAGQVYWPALGINQIGSMMPGQGYLMNLSTAATLIYPANSASAEAMMAGLHGHGENTDPTPAMHHSSGVSNTGVNATLLVESSELREGDEIAVWTASRRLVGRGVIRQGKALIAVWGDNNMIGKNIEGAAEGETLTLEAWSESTPKDKPLAIVSLANGLTGQEMANDLRYQSDAVWMAKVAVKEIPSTFLLSQNYPNPFNPSTIIKYGLPHEVRVKLEIYDMLGQRVAVLVDEKQPAGYHEAVFESRALPSGVYFYRLQAGAFSQTNKMAILR